MNAKQFTKFTLGVLAFFSVIVIVTVVVVSCVPVSTIVQQTQTSAMQTQAAEPTAKATAWPSSLSVRQIDREAGVVCYVYPGTGVSCLPIKDTELVP